MTAPVASFTIAALACFAANSILCRLALRDLAIDPATFTAIRITSGAALLWALIACGRRSPPKAARGSWISAAMLALYAIAFALAYVSLDAGVGAMILFGSVQATMIGWGLAKGERPGRRVWCGLAIAVWGLVWLMSPGAQAPPLQGTALMALAGFAWGVYSLRGRSAEDPVAVTAGNFLLAAPMALAAAALGIPWSHVEPVAALYAIFSGAVTSGLGYVAWYKALPGLSAARAAVAQLAVPVLAAAAGVALLAEQPTLRLALAGSTTLFGVAVALLGPPRGVAVDSNSASS